MQPSNTVFVIAGPIDRADIPGLCDCFRELLDDVGPGRVACDVGALAVPDAVAVEALARLQLQAQRLGLRMSLSQPSPELVELLSLTGLRGVLPINRPSGVETWRQPEEWEEGSGVEEERDPGNPAV